jgi:glutamate-1-semialdehyde 2,1-aminomutase
MRPMAVSTPRQIDRSRIRELTEREERRLDERTQASRAMYDRADRVLSGGVA